MWLRCDKTGDLPVSVWEQRKHFSEFSTQDTKVHGTGLRKHVSSPHKTHRPKNRINDTDLSSPRSTHVDIYQGVRELDGGTEAVATHPSIEPKNSCSNNFAPLNDTPDARLKEQKAHSRILSLGNGAGNAKRRAGG